MPLQQGSTFNMSEVRSYTNGQRSSYGAAPPHGRGNGDFINALQDAVRDNPISAALIGMGVLWMFMGGSNTSLFGGDGRKSIFGSEGQGADQVGGIVRDTATRVGSSMGQAADAAAETASQVAGGVRQASAAVADRGSRTAGQAADAIASAYDATTDIATRAANTVSNAATSAAHTMQQTGTKWGNTVQHSIADLFERQPLLLGAVGVAIGAGIAASIPTTDVENKVMGDASDLVRDTVSEQTAKVRKMADAAVEEAKEQGFTPEAAGEALRAIGNKLGAVQTANPAAKSASGSKKM
jgi:hypothetical protein